jgi:ribosome-associated toxin RatA of RatAB toxin-antitoxin module
MWSWITGSEPAKTEEEAPKVTDITDENGVAHAGIANTMLVEGASVKDCYDVISTVERYPEFLSMYNKVEILSEEYNEETKTNVRVARYVLNIPSILKAIISEITYTLKLECMYDADKNVAKMVWTAVDGPSFVVENSGEWNVSDKGSDANLQLDMAVGYSFYIPSYIKNWIQSSMVTGSLNDIKTRAQTVKQIEQK